jgi:hypothetical protein
MKNLIDKFENLKGCKFIAVNGYKNSAGEIANHNVNVNINVYNVKVSDFESLSACDEAKLISIADSTKISLDICKTALNEMLLSAEKNLSANFDEHTAQSKGQTDAYIKITNAIRLHKETLAIHIFGMRIAKKIIVEGTYKTVKSSDKTLAKKAITKALDLRAGKFRDYILLEAEAVKISGDEIFI